MKSFSKKEGRIIQERLQTKTLGASWSPLIDSFSIHISKQYSNTPTNWTQRKLLRLISQRIDTLGLIAPVTIVIKLQGIWWKGQNRDDVLPDDLQVFIKEWTIKTANLKEIQVPQYYELPEAQPFQLQVFCDATTRLRPSLQSFWSDSVKKRLLHELSHGKNQSCTNKITQQN